MGESNRAEIVEQAGQRIKQEALDCTKPALRVVMVVPSGLLTAECDLGHAVQGVIHFSLGTGS